MCAAWVEETGGVQAPDCLVRVSKAQWQCSRSPCPGTSSLWDGQSLQVRGPGARTARVQKTGKCRQSSLVLQSDGCGFETPPLACPSWGAGREHAADSASRAWRLRPRPQRNSSPLPAGSALLVGALRAQAGGLCDAVAHRARGLGGSRRFDGRVTDGKQRQVWVLSPVKAQFGV